MFNAGVDDLWADMESLFRRHVTGLGTSSLLVQREIAQELNALLKRRESTLKSLGILGAAFLFDEGGDGGWNLFESSRITDGSGQEFATVFSEITSVSTPYIIRKRLTAGITKSAIEALVHGLFVSVRKLQERAVRASEAEPEFFKWLPRTDHESPFEYERPFRDYLGVHYVSAGEMQVAFLAWRALQTLISLGRGSEPLGSISKMAATLPVAASPARWLDYPLDPISNPSTPEAAILVSVLREQIGAFKDWKGELKYWLHRPADVKALNRFVYAAKLADVVVSANAPSPELVGGIVVAYCRTLSGRYDLTVEAALALLEREARFPLPAYFYWQLSENRARAHLVAPVWTSALNPKTMRTVDGGAALSQPSVGLALVAVDPISELEPPENNRNVPMRRSHRSRAISAPTPMASDYANTIQILNILRQISRPLVEFVFYEPVKWREKAAQANQLVASIMSRNLSHNIGSHVLYHLREELADTSQQIRDLIKYLQARMDFIALVSSGGATWPGTVTFETLKHPFFDSKSLLVKHIVRSQREMPPIIQFRLQKNGALDTDLSDRDREADFAIPSGTVGAQALYSILENFVRNSAKYGLGPHNDVLRVNLDIIDDPAVGGYYRCLLHDNNTSTRDGATQVLQSFSEPLYDHRNPEASYRHWGLKEIKVAALYLVGGVSAIRSEYDFMGRPFDGPKPAWHLDDRDGNCSLKFEFFLRRPLGICLVGAAAAEAPEAFGQASALLRVCHSPHEIRRLETSSDQKFEIILLDQTAFDEVARSGTLTGFTEHAMRLAYIGESTSVPLELARLGAVSVASSWKALAALVAMSPGEPWKAIGDAWVNAKWPGQRMIFACSDPGRFSELAVLVETVRKEFSEAPAEASVTDLKSWLVWDHTKYEKTKPVYDSFGFHCPVSAPFYPGVNVRDGAWRMKEAACARVGVMDERIWESRFKDAKPFRFLKLRITDRKIQDVWSRAGLTLFDPALMEQSDVKCGDSPMNRALERFDFLVVHRSLIDEKAVRLREHDLPTRKPLPRDAYVFDLINWLKSATEKLVITSGRGLEPAYRHVLSSTGVGFVEFSALADALIDNVGDKVGLLRLLRST